jgi:hypothetical protein
VDRQGVTNRRRQIVIVAIRHLPPTLDQGSPWPQCERLWRRNSETPLITYHH